MSCHMHTQAGDLADFITTLVQQKKTSENCLKHTTITQLIGIYSSNHLGSIYKGYIYITICVFGTKNNKSRDIAHATVHNI